MEASKCPSLPSNYVSIVQLQERWIKEQERKQREKEEADKKIKEDAEEKRRQGAKEENKLERSDETDPGSFVRYGRQNRPKHRRASPKSEESRVEKERDGSDRNGKQLRSSRQGNWKTGKQWENGEIRAQDDEGTNAVAEHAPSSGDFLARRHRNGDVAKEARLFTEEIGPKLRNLSLNGGRGQSNNRASTARMLNGSHRNFGVHQGNDRRGGRQRTIWVRKGDVSDVDGGGIQSTSSSGAV